MLAKEKCKPLHWFEDGNYLVTQAILTAQHTHIFKCYAHSYEKQVKVAQEYDLVSLGSKFRSASRRKTHNM